MPLPVVADTYLCKLVWSSVNAPRRAVNDLFFHDDAGGHTGTDVYNAIDAHVTSNMWTPVAASASVVTVTTTKLDGSAASIDHATASPAKWTGQGGTDLILQGCQVVTLRTGFRGRSRRGRVYLPWIAEVDQDNGVINVGNVTAVQTGWAAFLTAMKAAGYPLHVCSRLHNDSIEVVSVTAQPYLKTQRRRTRR